MYLFRNWILVVSQAVIRQDKPVFLPLQRGQEKHTKLDNTKF